MHNVQHRSTGLTLTELLVALAILALVAAVIVPNFFGLRDKARDVALAAISDNLNRTYAEWLTAGGTTGEAAITSDVLKKMSSNNSLPIFHNPSLPITISSPDGTITQLSDPSGELTRVADSGSSANIRTSLPSGVVLEPETNSQIVETDIGYVIWGLGSKRTAIEGQMGSFLSI